MKYSYYPGCTLRNKAKDLDEYARASARAGHPFYVGTQAHPEFKSRPNHAHPLFRGFIQAAVDKKISEEQQQK